MGDILQARTVNTGMPIVRDVHPGLLARRTPGEALKKAFCVRPSAPLRLCGAKELD